MNELSLSRNEMNCYCRYLLGKTADEKSLQLFDRAIQHEATVLTRDEIVLLEFMTRHPWSIGFIDAAMGLFFHHHRLRKRMTIAFAILETSPLYFDFFRPKVYRRSYIFNLIGGAVKEVIMALTGRVILLFF